MLRALRRSTATAALLLAAIGAGTLVTLVDAGACPPCPSWWACCAGADSCSASRC